MRFFLFAVFALGVLRKPAFFHAFALLEDFADAPERREASYSEDYRPEQVVDPPGEESTDNAHQQKQPPDAHAEIVFAFDYQRMERADYQKCAKPDYETGKVVLLEKFCHISVMNGLTYAL